MSGKMQSLQDRLMQRDFYRQHSNSLSTDLSRDNNQMSFGILLRKNYRSHRHMLQIPSKLFYNGVLEAHANEDQVNSLLSWSRLPANSDFPLLFIG